MLGRTYALGYEPDLEDVLLQRPRRTVLNPAWPWAVWYPLRRSGRFAQLPADEQRVILAEHGAIGMSFGAGDYAHDVRLACHGLDKDDNDFVVGLIGKDLFPLSAIVQAMRKTQQTSLYLERLGPFFVGRAVWQSAPVKRNHEETAEHRDTKNLFERSPCSVSPWLCRDESRQRYSRDPRSPRTSAAADASSPARTRRRA